MLLSPDPSIVPSLNGRFPSHLLQSASFQAILLLAMTAAAPEKLEASQDYSPKGLREIEADYSKMLAGENATDKIVAKLIAIEDQEALDRSLVALARASQSTGKYDTTTKLFDALRSRGNLQCTILAADFLLKTADVLNISAYGGTQEVRDFPDELCRRAVPLLDHSDPVIQAMAEWMLALRVKQLDATEKKFSEMFVTGSRSADWHDAWLSRPRRCDLNDDYGRQLVHLNRHRTIEGVRESLERISARIEQLLAAEGSLPPGKTLQSYKAAVTKTQDYVAGGDLLQAHRAYVVLRKTARELIMTVRPEFPREGMVFYTNPSITGGTWNVNVAVTGRTNVPVGGLYIKRSSDPAVIADPLLGDRFEGGSIRGIDLDWEAKHLVFSFWHQPIDGSIPFGWNYRKNACLYELDLATGKVRKLTDSPGSNDIEPCFLPDGGYVFASDRSSFGNQCAGPFLQNKRCTTLYRLDPSRADRPIAISNNKDFDRHPHVLNDGTIVFLHWEYQERDLYHLHNAWKCRPDGTNMDAFYKQHISVPMSIRDVQQAPDSSICVATAQGHHDGHNGPVVLFDPQSGINNDEAMWNVTPGVSSIEGGFGPLKDQIVPEGGVENRGGSYINPFPLSEKSFLCSHDMTQNESEFAIYYIDVWGNRELLHKDSQMSAFMPHPLGKRKRPPIVADMVRPEMDHAVAFVENVYADLPGVEAGAVKYLRVSQRLMLPAPVDYEDPHYEHNHLHYLPGDATARHFAHWTWAPTRTIGIVEVAEDGRAYFKVPAGTPIFLQALDENYCEIRRMRTSFTLQRGELRSCTGCHESRLASSANRAIDMRATRNRTPQMPVPPSWGDTTVLDYRQHIQPIFDRHCISCHDAVEPDGELDLTKREIGGFAQSYRALFGLEPQAPTPIKELDWHLELHPEAEDDPYIVDKEARDIHKKMQTNQWPGQLIAISDRHDDADVTQPYQFGTNRSRLIRVMLDDPMHRDIVRSEMSEEEWLRLVTWIDHNAVYHSTLIDVSKYKSDKVLTRVPYYLPSPWVPSDLNPSFWNTADARCVPVEIQAEAVESFRPYTIRQKAVFDESGNVIKMAISNHRGFWQGDPEAIPERMPEALFQQEIRNLPYLEAIAIEKQNFSDASYELLGQMERLRDVRLHYMESDAGATADAPLFINRLPLPLEVLEIKHNFSIDGGCMDRLKPQPELRKLELDTGYAGSDCAEFIQHSPKIENLQLHRTTVNDAQLQDIFSALPELQILLLRPSGRKNNQEGITGRSLRGITECPKLRLVILGLQWKELPFEGGLEALARLPELEKLILAPNDIGGFSLAHPAVQKLHQARPDILILWGEKKLGGVDDRETEQEDEDWNWDGGVTTHG